jgi:hypothetical protein
MLHLLYEFRVQPSPRLVPDIPTCEPPPTSDLRPLTVLIQEPKLSACCPLTQPLDMPGRWTYSGACSCPRSTVPSSLTCSTTSTSESNVIISSATEVCKACLSSSPRRGRGRQASSGSTLAPGRGCFKIGRRASDGRWRGRPGSVYRLSSRRLGRPQGGSRNPPCLGPPVKQEARGVQSPHGLSRSSGGPLFHPDLVGRPKRPLGAEGGTPNRTASGGAAERNSPGTDAGIRVCLLRSVFALQKGQFNKELQPRPSTRTDAHADASTGAQLNSVLCGGPHGEEEQGHRPAIRHRHAAGRAGRLRGQSCAVWWSRAPVWRA